MDHLRPATGILFPPVLGRVADVGDAVVVRRLWKAARLIRFSQECTRTRKDVEAEAFNNAIKDPDIPFSVHAEAACLTREAKASLERLGRRRTAQP
jgi:hypothetical protein